MDPLARQVIFRLSLDRKDCKERQEREDSLVHRALKALKASAVSLEKSDLLEQQAKMAHLAREVLKGIAVTVERPVCGGHQVRQVLRDLQALLVQTKAAKQYLALRDHLAILESRACPAHQVNEASEVSAEMEANAD